MGVVIDLWSKKTQEIRAEEYHRLSELLAMLQTETRKLEIATEGALAAAKELKKVCDRADAQRRRPIR